MKKTKKCILAGTEKQFKNHWIGYSVDIDFGGYVPDIEFDITGMDNIIDKFINTEYRSIVNACYMVIYGLINTTKTCMIDFKMEQIDIDELMYDFMDKSNLDKINFRMLEYRDSELFSLENVKYCVRGDIRLKECLKTKQIKL